MAETTVSVGTIKPCDNQVGGHMAKDQTPDMFTDDQGRFYKPYQKGLRADREQAFYMTLYPPEGSKRKYRPSPPIPEDEQPAAMESEDGEFPKEQDVEGLKPFVAQYFGMAEQDGRKFIVLEDITSQYNKPCVIDCKLGYKACYDWAEPAYLEKNGPKDKSTTQATVGFRISGAQVYRAKKGEMFKTDRQWGKTLDASTIHEAFELFADNGVIPAEALYGSGENSFVSQLKRLEAWAQRQTSFQFYQASVLLVYEGTAEGIEDAKLTVKLVDFAHTFGACAGANPGDPSFLKGLQSLISIIEKCK